MKNIFCSFLFKILVLTFLSNIILTSCDLSNQEEKKKEITFWGDSMTAGAGGQGTTISAVVGNQLNRKTNNNGVGGLSSDNIAVLQGGLPLIIKIDDNTIPASGDVIITEYNILPFNEQTSQSKIGYLSNIKGEIIRIHNMDNPQITDHFIFKRSVKGNPVKIKDGAKFIFENAINHINDVTVIWAGRNDPRTDIQISIVKNNILSMVNHLNKNNKKYIIISVCNGESRMEHIGTQIHSNIISLNNNLKETFKDDFLDVRKYMVEQAIYDSGITPTLEDVTDINSDCIPTSLRSDGVHFNAKGYEMAGKFIAKYISDKNW